MNGDTFEKAENKMLITVTNLRIFESKNLNIWIYALTTTNAWNIRANSDARSSLGQEEK